MKFLIAAVIYVFTYNPYNTLDERGFIEEYEDDIEISIRILNEINLSSGELNTEGNILFLTVIYQSTLDRNVEQEFEQSMNYVTTIVKECKDKQDCGFLKNMLTKYISFLESEIRGLKKRSGRKQDLTFFKEYHRSGKKVLSRIYDKVVMINITSPEDFEREYSKIETGAAVMVMDHAGHRNFGMKTKKFIGILANNPPQELLLGICRSHLVVDDLKQQLPNTTLIYTEAEEWYGFDSRLRGYEGVFPKGYVRR